MFFTTTQLEAGQIYQHLVGAIVPRPIAWISTLNAQGIANLAPYSFFTVASVNPPILAVSHIAPRQNHAKDTLANLREHPECVVNIVSAELAEPMNASCAAVANEVDEFELAQVARSPSNLVKPPAVAAAKVRYECRLREIQQLSEAPAGGSLILLDVAGIYLGDDVINQDGKIDGTRLDAIGKLGGDNYSYTRDIFAMARP
jgi:flavin reductase (DIM6/NTAB) family NADH-FMN oxidoreductase RutF